MLRRFIVAFALTLMPPAAYAADDSKADAHATLERFHNGISSVLKASSGLDFQGRTNLLCPVLEQAMAIKRQSARAVGARAWNTWSQDQRDAYAAYYRDYLCASYADRFDADVGQTFHIVGERPGPRGSLLLLTEVRVPGTQPVAINYVMQEINGRWGIIDLFLDGTISEVALRRSEFAAVLRDQGYDALITAIAEKTASRGSTP